MVHIAIMKKSWNLLPKILSGEKTIESRWYKFKRPPFECIFEGDIVYFKESGDPVSVKAKVERVLTYENLTPEMIFEIIEKYGNFIGIDLSFMNEVKDKKYCILIFLNDVHSIKPFEINKKGFGMMNAWISVDNINKLSNIYP